MKAINSCNRNSHNDLLIGIVAAFLIIILAFLFSGCMTARKAVDYMDNHALMAAKYCNSRFPINTILKPGRTLTQIDTVVQSGQSISCPVLAGLDSLIYVKCPPNRVITIQKIRVDTLPIVDTRQISSLQDQILALTQSNGKLLSNNQNIKKGRTTWRYIGILGIIIILTGAFTFIAVKFKFL